MSSEPEEFYVLNGGYDTDGKWYLGRVRLCIVDEFDNYPDWKIDHAHAELDIEEIRKTFEKLNFKVDKAIMNPTAAKFVQFINEKLDYFGFSIIFIFSHGEENYFYTKDYDEKTGNGKIDVRQVVYHQFSGENMPEMRQCPKVFFNEWCQIDKRLLTKNVSKKIELKKVDTDSETSDSDDSEKEIPKYPDSSFRNTAHWFIYNAAQPKYESHVSAHHARRFCQLLNKHAKTKDLEEIWKLLKNDVCKVEVDLGTHEQPECILTNVGKLYLLPVSEVYLLKVSSISNFK
jgi:hypothetical protein